MMQHMAYIAFGLYALLIVGGSLVAVTSRAVVRAFAGLLVSFVGVAGVYFLMDASFVGLMQILIYVGAVCVIIFMAVMLTVASRQGQKMSPTPLKRRVTAFLAGGVVAAILCSMVLKYPLVHQAVAKNVPMAELGRALLGPYMLAFELISVVLFVAMVGAMILVQERRKA